MANTVATVEGTVTPSGLYQQLSGTTLASLALTVPDDAQFALITVNTNAIRYRDDGVLPTATVGFPIAVGQTLKYTGILSQLKMIPQTGTAGIDVVYYTASP